MEWKRIRKEEEWSGREMERKRNGVEEGGRETGKEMKRKGEEEGRGTGMERKRNRKEE
jgi:hypothetical protein